MQSDRLIQQKVPLPPGPRPWPGHMLPGLFWWSKRKFQNNTFKDCFFFWGGGGIQILILQLYFIGKIQKQSLELRPSTWDQTWCFGLAPLFRSPSKTVAPKKFNDKIIPTPCLACSPPRSSSKVKVNAWITSDPARKNSRCSCRTKENIIQYKVQWNLVINVTIVGPIRRWPKEAGL